MFNTLKQSLTIACKALNLAVEFGNEDETQLELKIEGIDFLVGAEKKIEKLGLGKVFDREVVEYQTFYFKYHHGSYWNPPETEDVELGEPTKNPRSVINELIKFVVFNRVDCALEYEAEKEWTKELEELEKSQKEIDSAIRS